MVIRLSKDGQQIDHIMSNIKEIIIMLNNLKNQKVSLYKKLKDQMVKY